MYLILQESTLGLNIAISFLLEVGILRITEQSTAGKADLPCLWYLVLWMVRGCG